ncbi:hypothetical protein [Streptomyces acidiscabies]|uniref:hypothetical protein n=1 Tax=Streptomyces acidiscabies TaxID=42234 RepID=UPI0015BA5294|nr:hypothetical protein [Streptomyces acidiscabies]
MLREITESASPVAYRANFGDFQSDVFAASATPCHIPTYAADACDRATSTAETEDEESEPGPAVEPEDVCLFSGDVEPVALHPPINNARATTPARAAVGPTDVRPHKSATVASPHI